MPCVGGVPQEFAAQDAFAVATKAAFPAARVLQYRVTSAVPYAAVVHDAIVERPEMFIRWAANNSVCQMPYVEHGTAGQGCAWDIVASSYNFADAATRAWFVDNIIAPSLAKADGVWLDGDGPDNGAWMCSGQCCEVPAPYPATSDAEVAAYCAGEQLLGAEVHAYLAAHGGFDYNCFTFIQKAADLPNATDGGAACGAKLERLAASAHNATVVYTDRTGSGKAYTAATAGAAAAAFLLARGPLWWFGVTSDASQWTGAVAEALLSDFGAPRGNMTRPQPGSFVYTREYERATVALDCATFEATITPA